MLYPNNQELKTAYSNSEVTTNKNVSVNIQTSDIEEALLAVLEMDIHFKQIDDYIAHCTK